MFIKESVIDHITRLFSYRRVGNYPLVVTVGSDLAEALASSREHARVIAAITGLATFLLAGLAAYSHSRDPPPHLARDRVG
jgi:hypothetical protein